MLEDFINRTNGYKKEYFTKSKMVNKIKGLNSPEKFIDNYDIIVIDNVVHSSTDPIIKSLDYIETKNDKIKTIEYYQICIDKYGVILDEILKKYICFIKKWYDSLTCNIGYNNSKTVINYVNRIRSKKFKNQKHHLSSNKAVRILLEA